MIFGSWVYPRLPKLLIVQFPQELIFCLVDSYSRSQIPVFCELLSGICIAVMTLRLCLITLFYWIPHIWCSTPCNEGDVRKHRGWRTAHLSCLRAREVTGVQKPPIKPGLTAAPPTAEKEDQLIHLCWLCGGAWGRGRGSSLVSRILVFQFLFYRPARSVCVQRRGEWVHSKELECIRKR